MKNIYGGILFPLILISLAIFAGCPEPGTEIIDGPFELVYSVWAGETPRPGDWLTIAFKPDGKVVFSFSIDNTSNEWEYAFDSDLKTGTIIVPGGWNPAPNGFSISGNTLTITNYGSHAGDSREFKRFR